MSYIGDCCVNLSGSSCPVYNSANQKIGDIMPREFFTLIGIEGSLTAIYFMKPDGSMETGYFHSPPSNVTIAIHTRPYSTVTLNGYTYVAFMMRNQMNLYNCAGNIVGSVAAGKRVLCKTSMAHPTLPYLKAINYAEKRTGGWDTMADSTGTYGYVDTGMRISTGWSGISLYGNW